MQGLSEQEAIKRLAKYGHNEITGITKVSPIKLAFEQIKSPLIFILLAAAFLSLFLKEYSDAAFILIVVIINTALGFYQEYKAENTLEALQSKISKTVKVLRDGEFQTIDIKYLVPGDLIQIESGLRVPADGYLLEAEEITINESILTGESEPVEKIKVQQGVSRNDENRVYMGSNVISGLGIAKIEKTGSSTKFGQIAENLETNLNPQTPIKAELIKLSKLITILILSIIAVIILIGLVRGIDFEEIFLTSVALGVSTIPEGLIISLTVTLALGMNRIMSKKAIVKNLPAAETLGDIDVLCIDKTGTLTYGNMQVNDTEFTNKEQALTALAICNNNANFIDNAIIEYIHFATKKDFLKNVLESRTKLFPFTSIKKYTGAYDGKHLYAVGAPEKIFEFSTRTDTTKWIEHAKQRALQGNRMIAISYKKMSNSNPTRDDFNNMYLLGLVYIKDPVRHSASQSLQEIKSAGIDVKIITGDLKETSLNVLHTLNFPIEESEIISGKKLSGIRSESKFQKIVKKTKLFYRTTPDQKLHIVKALQAIDKRVGMMGDGVNDSPAIKKSEIGICVDNATDVSKEVADLILLDSNFKTIVDAVEEGRNIFKNLRKILTFLLADSLTETVLIFLALLFKLPLPLTPLLLLWINIIEDGLPSLALSFDRSSTNLLKDKPRDKNDSLLNKKVTGSIISISLIKDVLFFGVYVYLLNSGYVVEHAQTFIFAGISASSLLFIYSAKTVESNIWKEKIFNNPIVNFSVVLGFILLLATLYWAPLSRLLNTYPLTSFDFILIFIISVISILLVEIVKFFINKAHP